jgi:hypothetical protein
VSDRKQGRKELNRLPSEVYIPQYSIEFLHIRALCTAI